jgi:hypothetical protein
MKMKSEPALTPSEERGERVAISKMDFQGSAENVTVTCGNFTNNTGRGLDVISSGLITLKGVTYSGNSSTNFTEIGPFTPLSLPCFPERSEGVFYT